MWNLLTNFPGRYGLVYDVYLYSDTHLAALLPPKVDIVLDMTGLSRLLDCDHENLTLSVQAGLTIAGANDHLAQIGKPLFMALDPPRPVRTTLGGAYMADIAGPWQLSYGTLRDQVLGIRAVDASGCRFKAGGLTVKNVAGYDLTKFFIGSAGSLCVLTRMSLRIYPLPEAAAVVTLTVPQQQEAKALLAHLRSGCVLPAAVVVTPVRSEGNLQMVVAFEGHPKAVDRQCRDLMKQTDPMGLTPEIQTDRQSMTARLQAAVASPSETQYPLALKVSVPVDRGLPILDRLKKLSHGHRLDAHIALLAGSGVLYWYSSSPEIDAWPQFIASLRDIIQAYLGWTLPLKAPLKWADSLKFDRDAVLTAGVIRPLKRALDPRGVLLSVG